MTAADRARFAAVLVGCAETWGRAMSGKAIEVYWQALREAGTIDAIEAAFWRHLRSPDSGQYFPKPADIIRMLDGTSLDASMVAWSKVEKAVRQVGPYASVSFDDPLCNRVLADMGGWILLCQKRDDEWPFVGNEFRARYKGYRSRDEHPEYPARLIGITEHENKQGATIESLVLIGDKDRAREVFAKGNEAPALGFQRLGAVKLLERRKV
jgi:hypothetical protein